MNTITHVDVHQNLKFGTLRKPGVHFRSSLSPFGYPCTILQTGYKVFGSTNRIAQSKHQKGHLPIYSAQTDAENHYNYT